MPYNVPTVTTSDISFGPAVLYLGVAGTTPLTDVGAITEDGCSIEITSEKRTISQGNPKIPVYSFSQAQGVKASFTGIEWNYPNFAAALGAGVTTTSGTEETYAFGGDPIVTRQACHIQHYMASSGNTLNVYLWEAVSEGGLTIPLVHDEHSFEYNLIGQRVADDWSGAALAVTEQLMKIVREI